MPSTSIRAIAQKHVWIVDDHEHAVFKMTNDGKQIVQTLGTPNKAGADGAHFNRPTFLPLLPDSSVFVADGYNGNRVAKFDKDGKFLWTSGDARHARRHGRPGPATSIPCTASPRIR